MAFDPYQILGVAHDVSVDELRQIYRSLARKYHPDVNKSAGAEEHFKLLGQAYSVLSDAGRRALFDEFGEASLAIGFDARAARAQARSAGRGGAERGRPAEGERRPREKEAPRRHGEADPRRRAPAEPSGRWPGERGHGRSREDGPGRDRMREGPVPQGREDHGPRREDTRSRRWGREEPQGREDRGLRGDESPDVHAPLEIDLLTAIHGGEVKLTAPAGGALSVHLPPGVQSGYQLRMKGRGRAGRRGGMPGDLFLEVVVLPHPYFRREGYDLVLELPVTIPEAHQGASVQIPTLEGWVRVPVPAGSRGGERLRLRGKGLPDEDGGRGDLYVHLSVRLPERLDAAGRALERLAGLYSEDLRADLHL